MKINIPPMVTLRTIKEIPENTFFRIVTQDDQLYLKTQDGCVNLMERYITYTPAIVLREDACAIPIDSSRIEITVSP